MISLNSCYLSRKEKEIKIINNFCQLHTPLSDELDGEIVSYWQQTSQSISAKNKSGGVKTPAEKFAEVMINYAGDNDKKYYEKKCDQL